MTSQAAKRPRWFGIRTVLPSMPLRSAWAKASERLFAHRVIIYICVLLMASIAAYGYGIRTRTIFACQADGYSTDRYLAYCNGANYADYEHGAFGFDLEPLIRGSVRNADVLFLGNSRVQVGFSTPETERWFSANSARYYLLGFSYFENAFFEGRLLNTIGSNARVFVINLNDYFEQTESVPARTIVHDPKASADYAEKRLWQRIHQRVCGAFPAICGKQFVIFRSRSTGAYYTEGAVGPKVVPVTYDSVVNQRMANANIAEAAAFLARFAQDKCVILTIVPYVGTEIGTAEAIASGLGLKLVTPGNLQGLETYDGYHLDQASARLWSQAFFQAAGSEIRSCLERRGTTARQNAPLTGPSPSVQDAATAIR